MDGRKGKNNMSPDRCLLVYTRISFNSLLRFREPVNGLWPKLRELIRFGDFDHNFRGHHHMKAVFYSVWILTKCIDTLFGGLILFSRSHQHFAMSDLTKIGFPKVISWTEQWNNRRINVSFSKIIVTPMRLEPATPWSRVKHSTTQQIWCRINIWPENVNVGFFKWNNV